MKAITVRTRTLTIRKWLLLAWLSYALLPGVGLGIMFGVLRLVTGVDPTKTPPLTAIAVTVAALVQVSVLVVFGLFIGRAVRRPLVALQHASGQIAAGNLDVDLPPSHVREVAEISSAFAAMGHDLGVALHRQAELEQERRFFISAIAHDLRTPIFSLRGYLQGLEQGIADTPEKTTRYITICQEKADELERLVADLFAYTRLEYLEQAPRRERVEMGALFGQAVEGMRPQAEAKGISLTLDGVADGCAVEGDAHLITRAVTNLLDNALRHTPPGGSIRVEWRAERDGCIFTVTDTGAGIAAHDLPHLFEPLYRSETSRSRETGGAGLGLAIARRILHAHGGDLTAANAATGGAIFTGSIGRPTGMTVPVAS